jgi:HK97 gp10 family phage protein
MPRASIKIDGAEGLIRKLKKMPGAAGAAILESLIEGSELIKKDAERDAPSRTGKLKMKIETEVKSLTTTQSGTRHRKLKADADYKGQLVADIGPTKDVWYGIFAEYGTAHHGAQPFLRPAADNNFIRIKGIFIRKLNKHIRKLVDGPG